MVGGNDIKNLFIYSIHEEIPVNTVIKESKKKDGTVFKHSFGYYSFLFLGGDFYDRFTS